MILLSHHFHHEKLLSESSQRGSTLIELMTALFVLSVGLVGVLALTTSNVRNQNIGVSRLIASNLAREGIELARSIRDSNWLAEGATDSQGNPVVWNSGLGGNSDHCGIVSSQGDSLIFVSCTANPPGAAVYQVYAKGEEYSQKGPAENISGARPLSFFRTIQSDPLCLSGGQETVVEGSGSCPGSEQEKIGVRITSRVVWFTSGQRTVTQLTESLYHWR